jgi:hypothetical protein
MKPCAAGAWQGKGGVGVLLALVAPMAGILHQLHAVCRRVLLVCFLALLALLLLVALLAGILQAGDMQCGCACAGKSNAAGQHGSRAAMQQARAMQARAMQHGSTGCRAGLGLHRSLATCAAVSWCHPVTGLAQDRSTPAM